MLLVDCNWQLIRYLSIMQRLLLLPMELEAHARQIKAVMSVCEERVKVWQEIFKEWLPDHRLTRRGG